jgi:signal transduction histidine kinase
MIEFFRKLFDSDFMPHGHCYFWQPEIVSLHVSSDALIAAAYFCIPFTLANLVRRRRDLAFNWMFVLFGVFICACGATHAMSIWTLWHGTYRLEGIIKLITALASVPTAILLIRLVPQAVLLPSPEQLGKVNRRLELEIVEHAMTENQVRKLNAELERRVQELKELIEQLRASNEDLHQFAHVASHDLQEPLRSVAIYGELLQKHYAGKLDQSGEGFLQQIAAAAQRMQNLLSDLLAYAQAGAAAGQVSSVDCNLAIEKALFSLQVSIQQEGAQIDRGRLPAVRAVEIHVIQIFQNLIGNAIKYHGREAPRVSIDAALQDGQWMFRVRDNGIGIPPEFGGKIFALFTRLHGNKYPGTGIGLALCSKIVHRYGGRIWVESEPGPGSCFCFTLPAVSEEREVNLS